MRRLDETLEDVGEFGAYQRKLYYFLLVTSIFPVLHKFIWQFNTFTPPHRCKMPFESATNVTFVFDESLDNKSFSFMDKCEQYDIRNASELLDENKEEFVNFNASGSCSEWIYEFIGVGGLVVEFNLVCNRSHFVRLGENIYVWSEMLGCVVWGILADRFGRKKMFFTCLALQAVSGFLTGMVTNLSGVLAMRAFLGFFAPASVIGSILRIEFIGPSMRMLAAMMDCAMSVVGQLFLVFCVYFLTNWRHLQIILSIPGFLFLSCWWFVPESARWLLAHKRERDGRRIISKLANRNRRELIVDNYESVRDEP